MLSALSMFLWADCVCCVHYFVPDHNFLLCLPAPGRHKTQELTYSVIEGCVCVSWLALTSGHPLLSLLRDWSFKVGAGSLIDCASSCRGKSVLSQVCSFYSKFFFSLLFGLSPIVKAHASCWNPVWDDVFLWLSFFFLLFYVSSTPIAGD